MLTIVGSVAQVVNGLSRAALAALADKIGFKPVYIFLQVTNLAMTASLGYVANQWVYLVLLSIIMGSYGAMLSTFPALSSSIFGHKVGPLIYGILFFGIGISNMIAYLFYKFVTPKIELLGLFWVCFGVKVIAFVLGVLFKPTHTWSRFKK